MQQLKQLGTYQKVPGIFHFMKDSAYFLYTLGLVSKIKLIFVNVMTV